MANKDQTIGGTIFIICLVVAIGYVISLFVPSFLGNLLGVAAERIQFWLIAFPVLIAFLAVLFIGAWIGWTMATTPPPKPLEEIEAEETTKAEKEKPEPAA